MLSRSLYDRKAVTGYTGVTGPPDASGADGQSLVGTSSGVDRRVLNWIFDTADRRDIGFPSTFGARPRRQ
jgi:hypothetical protein